MATVNFDIGLKLEATFKKSHPDDPEATGHKYAPTTCQISKDARLVFTAGRDSTVIAWDIAKSVACWKAEQSGNKFKQEFCWRRTSAFQDTVQVVRQNPQARNISHLSLVISPEAHLSFFEFKLGSNQNQRKRTKAQKLSSEKKRSCFVFSFFLVKNNFFWQLLWNKFGEFSVRPFLGFVSPHKNIN